MRFFFVAWRPAGFSVEADDVFPLVTLDRGRAFQAVERRSRRHNIGITAERTTKSSKVSLGLLLSVPAVALRILASVSQYTVTMACAWGFIAAVLAVTIFRLLQEVFSPGAVTRDKLFACATVYLLIGLLWCFLFAIVEELSPGAFSGLGIGKTVHVADLAYFSLNVATNIALTNIMPVSRWAQVLVLLLEYATVLYMTFVISRLVGMYVSPKPPSDKDSG